MGFPRAAVKRTIRDLARPDPDIRAVRRHFKDEAARRAADDSGREVGLPYVAARERAAVGPFSWGALGLPSGSPTSWFRRHSWGDS